MAWELDLLVVVFLGGFLFWNLLVGLLLGKSFVCVCLFVCLLIRFGLGFCGVFLCVFFFLIIN